VELEGQEQQVEPVVLEQLVEQERLVKLVLLVELVVREQLEQQG
jgi:hypothetical protein